MHVAFKTFFKNYFYLFYFMFFALLLLIYLFLGHSPESAEIAEVFIKPSVPLAPQAPVVEEVVSVSTQLFASSWTSYAMLAGGVVLVGAGLYFGLPFILPYFAAGSAVSEQVVEVAQNLTSEVSSAVGSVASDPVSVSAMEVVGMLESSGMSSQVSEVVSQVASIHPGFAVPVALFSYFSMHPIAEQVASTVSASVAQEVESATPVVSFNAPVLYNLSVIRAQSLIESSLLIEEWSSVELEGIRSMVVQNSSMVDVLDVVGTRSQIYLMCMWYPETCLGMAAVLSWPELVVLCEAAYLQCIGQWESGFDAFLTRNPTYPEIISVLRVAGLLE